MQGHGARCTDIGLSPNKSTPAISLQSPDFLATESNLTSELKQQETGNMRRQVS